LGAHARAAYPEECCGLLFAAERSVSGGSSDPGLDVVPCRNAAPDRRAYRFVIDPAELRELLRPAATRGARLAGVYHSHPNGRAVPSALDRSEALPGLLGAIVAIDRTGSSAVGLFRREAGPDGRLRDLGCPSVHDRPPSRIRPSRVPEAP